MTVLVEKNVLVPMRDGVNLAADVYRPSQDGRYPVLLQRTPYNKELWPITALTLDPIRAAAAGYAVVIQDVRGRWASEGEWPLSRAVSTPWYLGTNGELAMSAAPLDTQPDNYIYDPNDPCPTCGGGILLPPQYSPGPVNQAPILTRRDVLAYTSVVLENDLEVTGEVSAVLYAATSGRDTDWIVKLCDVHPDGTTINVCDGIVRASVRDGVRRQLVEPNAVVRYAVSLWSTAMVFKAEHRLRLLITSSDFPRYDRNPNTGELAHEATRLEPALQKVYRDAERASHIVLPVVAR